MAQIRNNKNSVHLTGNSQATLALTNTGEDTAALAGGVYDLFCTSDFYMKVDANNASDVTTATGYFVKGGETLPGVIIPEQYKLGAVLTSGTASLMYHKVGNIQ